MGLFSKYDRLEFKLACMNCLEAGVEYHTFNWEDFLKTIKKEFEDPECWNFYGIYLLRKTFWERKRACEYCGHIGTYDIFDLSINGKKYYKQPDSKRPFILIDLTKNNGETNGNINLHGNLNQINSFFQLIKNTINTFPKDFYISNDRGQFKVVVFENQKEICLVNYFIVAGYNYTELIELWDKKYKEVLLNTMK